jgi:hypothetical protein
MWEPPLGSSRNFLAGPNYQTDLASLKPREVPGPSSDFYFATRAAVAASTSLASDPDTVQDAEYGNYAFLLSCHVQFHAFNYNYVNGSLLTANLTPANFSIFNSIIWPFYYTSAYPINSLESAFIRGAQLSNTTQQVADYLAQHYSETALSLIAGIMSPRKTLAEQSREQLLVTRLPKAPLFTLLALNAMYVLVACMLASVAYTGQPRVVRDVQARLSITGLVAALLETGASPRPSASKDTSIGSLFREYHGHTGHRIALLLDERGRWNFEEVGDVDSKEEYPGGSSDEIGREQVRSQPNTVAA